MQAGDDLDQLLAMLALAQQLEHQAGTTVERHSAMYRHALLWREQAHIKSLRQSRLRRNLTSPGFVARFANLQLMRHCRPLGGHRRHIDSISRA